MLVLDCETYSQYFLVSFMDIKTEKVRYYEMYDCQDFNKKEVMQILSQFTTISFNGNNYDLPMLSAALQGFTNQGLKNLSDTIIKSKIPAWRIARDAELTIPTKWDHIDIIEVAPGMSSLKIYGGRLHSKTLQDLPYDPDLNIGPDERAVLRKYCINDLRLTSELFNTLKKQIALRVEMSKDYGMDLRSKSDAQIAETVIKSELSKLTGKEYRPPKLPDNYGFYYQDPKILKFETDTLKDVFAAILKERFGLGPNGAVIMPEWLRKNRINVAGKDYQMGMGGLHSCESRQFVKVKDGWILEDRDVASYYPNIILQQQLAPDSLGAPFLKVYQTIVERRLKAKKEGDKVTSDVLKITINGSFGKFGSKYSALYAPDLLIQTTVTGQLALLMLIERLTLIGVQVMSANTDGVVLYYPKSQAVEVEDVCFEWMLDTSYELESTPYKCVASRDVNNYAAVTTRGQIKGKGVFASSSLSKNPDLAIITRSVALQIAEGIDCKKTIRECDDVRQFVAVRRVTGGAIWRGEYLGNTVRFYLSNEVPQDESIHYQKNSNRVPKSAGARPLMVLPDALPADIDYHYYEVEAEKLLAEVGYL
jgi:DNA polymerase elongation subunit (family B)